MRALGIEDTFDVQVMVFLINFIKYLDQVLLNE